MRQWLQCLMGRHKWRWFRNIYGDEIMLVGYCRSVYRCEYCSRWQYRAELYVPTLTNLPQEGQEKEKENGK